MSRPGSPLHRSASRGVRVALLACAVVACAPLPPADGPLRPWQVAEVDRYAERLGRSPQIVEDAELTAWVGERLRLIDPDHGNRIQVFVIDQPATQADLVGGRVLRLRTGLLRELHSEPELLFVLAHEISHRRLGHLAAREMSGWDPVAAEIEADLDARRTLQSLGIEGGIGRELLARLAAKLERADDLATIRRRIDALGAPATVSDAAVEPYRPDEVRFARLLARYR